MHARKLLGHRELQVEVVLVVLEPDVEARPVVLDEAALENQGVHLIGCRDELEVGGPTSHLGAARGLCVSGSEVGAQPVTQTQRLADVDDLAPVVAEQVNARTVRHRPQAPLDRVFEGNRHAIDFRKSLGRGQRREIRCPGGPAARRGRAPERAHVSMRKRGAEAATTQTSSLDAEVTPMAPAETLSSDRLPSMEQRPATPAPPTTPPVYA